MDYQKRASQNDQYSFFDKPMTKRVLLIYFIIVNKF
jgi:hypothetical protein